MTLPTLLLSNLALIVVLFTMLWALGCVLRDVSIVDIAWGSGFVLIAWASYLLTDNAHSRSLLLAVMVTVWGIRLSVYLGWRNWGKPEDYRYVAMRERHGESFVWISLITVFGFQGAVMWVISLPIQIGVFSLQAWDVFAWIGLSLFLVGLAFESVGDFQLARFKADPTTSGQVMNRGLWRYTRHPNYFGDFLVWWGFYFMSLDLTHSWWTIVAPLLMSFFLMRVSGVPMLESSLKRRLEGYEEYLQTTSSFFPMPPARSRG